YWCARCALPTLRSSYAGLVECYANPVLPAPNDMAKQLQSVLGKDQCEFIGNTDQVRKIQRRARGGDIANGTSILVAAILDFGGLHDTDTRCNPVFDHREKFRRTIKGDKYPKTMQPKD